MEKYYQILFTDTYQPDKKLRNILIDLDDREVFLKKDENPIKKRASKTSPLFSS